MDTDLDSANPAIEGYMYIREESSGWTKRYCILHGDRIDFYKKDPTSGKNIKPVETKALTENHFVQAAATQEALKKRKHGFMLSDFVENIYFSGLYDGKQKKSQVNIDVEEKRITDQWLQVFGKVIAGLQSTKKWWIETEISIDEDEDELNEDFEENILAYKESRGADTENAKETELETEAAIARVFVSQARKAADRASIRFFDQQEKLQELLKLEHEIMEKQATDLEPEDTEGKHELARNEIKGEEFEEIAGNGNIAEQVQNEEQTKEAELETGKTLLNEQSQLVEQNTPIENIALTGENVNQIAGTEKSNLNMDEEKSEHKLQQENLQIQAKLDEMRQLEEMLQRAQEELERAKEEEELALQKLKVAEELALEAENERLEEAKRISVNPLAFDLDLERKKFEEEIKHGGNKSKDRKTMTEHTVAKSKKATTVKKKKTTQAGQKENGILAERLKMWQNKVDQHLVGQSQNVFSGGYQGEQRLKIGDEGYGKPVEGSKTDERAKAAAVWVDKEIDKMVEVIKKIGGYDEVQGGYTVTFGELFHAYQDISDTLVGILMRAKKRKRVYYIGDMLYQGMSDNVKITVIEESQEV